MLKHLTLAALLLAAQSGPVLAGSFAYPREDSVKMAEQAVGLSLQERFNDFYPVPEEDAGKPHDSVFGSVAIPFKQLSSASMWHTISSDIESQVANGCRSSHCGIELLSGVSATGSFMDLASQVNRIANSALTYSPDADTYAIRDHWATPEQALHEGKGDCEDYVFLKFALLRHLGVPAESMRVVILKDTRRGLHHAVLAVNTNRGIIVLDNVRREVRWDREIPDYQPLYSFMNDRSWIHGRRRNEEPSRLASAD